MTLLKVVLLVFFLWGGLQTFDSAVVVQSVAENIDKVAQIGLTSALVFITFFGFSAITTNAEEIKDPGRTIPRAIYLSMGIVTVIYALVVLVIVLAVNNLEFLTFLAQNVELGGLDATEFVAENGEVSMGYAAQYFLGPVGFNVIIVGALFSMLSAANATIMAGSRVKLSMARRNHLPKGFEDIHPDFNTPYKAVLLTGCLIFVYIFVFAVIFGESAGTEPLFGFHLGIEGLAQFANFLLLSGLSLVNVALIQSRRKFPDIERGFKVPLVPIVPALAIVANVGLLLNVGLVALLIGLFVEAIGVAVWFAWKGRKPPVERLEKETPTAIAEYAGPSDGYQIVVPIANPRNATQLMRTAMRIAEDKDGEILVMSVVTVPEQTPLSRGREQTDEKREILDRAMSLAEDADVPVSGTIRISHHAASAILNTITQYDSDAVIVGWKGRRTQRRDAVLGSNVDRIVKEADCDVYVEKFGLEMDGRVDSILLPTAGGPHAALAVETAAAIARSTRATLYPVYVLGTTPTREEREQGESLLATVSETVDDVPIETRLLENDDVVEALVDESANHDLTIIGATREGVFQKFLFGTIPETVAERAATSVIMTKASLELGTKLQESAKKLGERVTGRANPLEEDELK